MLDGVVLRRPGPFHDRRGHHLVAGPARYLRCQVEGRGALTARAEAGDDRHATGSAFSVRVATTCVTGTLCSCTCAVHDVEAMPHRLFGRQCRDHDLIRTERVNGGGQGAQRPVVTQFAVGLEVLGAKGGQRVVQPLLCDLPGRFLDVERTVGGGGSGLDRAGRHDDEVVGSPVRADATKLVEQFLAIRPSGWPAPARDAGAPSARPPRRRDGDSRTTGSRGTAR